MAATGNEHLSPSKVKTTLIAQQHLIAQTLPSHSEKPLETKGIWVKVIFVLDWDISNN